MTDSEPFKLTLLIDKPLDWTSFDVVNKLRWVGRKALGRKKLKVGHAGTLDPLASGLLIICMGKDTKKIPEYTGLNKTYTGTITLGATTPSFDLETEMDQEFPIDHISEQDIHETAKSFLGPQMQVPPIYSAKKMDGNRAYQLARKGQTMELKAAAIEIYDFKILNIDMPHVGFEVTASKGTYIRSLANDFGKKLNSGGHLSALRRTAIGDYLISNSLSIEEAIVHIEDHIKKL